MRLQANTDFERKLMDIFSEYTDLKHEFFHGEYSSSEDQWFSPDNDILDGISFVREDQYGGEGKGEDYWSVYKFTDKATGETVYLKFDGWYQSYNGADFDNICFVNPRQETVTVYD